MTGPVEQARLQAHLSLRRAALALDLEIEPALQSIRFRPDGKGGELASPFPLVVKQDAARVAKQCLTTGWFERIRSSGGWIAFDLSEQWRSYVRVWRPDWTAPPADLPPIPDFTAYIDEKSWRFCAMLGKAEAGTAARLDLGNPYLRMMRALQLASTCHGDDRPDRYLVNLAADCRDAEGLLRLTGAYLSHPGEDALVAKTLRHGKKSLGI